MTWSWRIVALPLGFPLLANSFGWIFTVSPHVSVGTRVGSLTAPSVVYAILAVVEGGLLVEYSDQLTATSPRFIAWSVPMVSRTCSRGGLILQTRPAGPGTPARGGGRCQGAGVAGAVSSRRWAESTRSRRATTTAVAAALSAKESRTRPGRSNR